MGDGNVEREREREREKIIWNFDNVQKAYATRGYEAKKQVSQQKHKTNNRTQKRKTQNPTPKIFPVPPKYPTLFRSDWYQGQAIAPRWCVDL
jgi:hypothetical protein